ncbi:leucine-rich repeat-containing protein 74B isoform X2 [Anarrhichthys ocellatus]|uniref:leucine-rich repeat-containing protein 74B isoform X2 n=1 Tax=Anarrhichthys ocellatus TaxID=433405 RepID=UPI0012ED3B5F|nr:leucine-rich repeat-containing protein 74B-like isoform X2 [Anarrhichthys ocellatus]
MDTLLPSVLEDGDAGSEKLQLGEQIHPISSLRLPATASFEESRCLTFSFSIQRRVSRTGVDVRGPKDQRSSPDGNVLDGGESGVEEEEEEEEENEEEELGGEERVLSDENYDTDLELGDDEEEACDPAGQTCYMEACEALQVTPVSYFLQHMQNSELSMMHRGLGPQGTKALAVPLVTNTSILRLNLRDNWMEGMGGAAVAEMLKENCYITEVDLSNNNLGDYGARAVAGMLKENSSLVSLNLSGNNFTDWSAEQLGPALIANSKLQHLDLSRNALGERAGKNLGDSLSENTGLRSLSLAWNCIRGRGAVMLANGLGGNIFLRTVDLTFNGFGKEGAIALGQALKENAILEELNVSNRIPPEGAIHLAMGLKVNKTIKSLNMGRNPIQNAGCYRILKSLQENPDSAMEKLDFLDITVNQDFEDLYTAVKEIFPALVVNHGGRVGAFRKAKA